MSIEHAPTHPATTGAPTPTATERALATLWQGEAPDGMGRHGETAEHLRGKKLIVDWALDQHYVLEPSVEEEVWVPGVRLRSDVTATLVSGRQLAFEVQRKPLDRKDWDRRHGGYKNGGVRDVWLWSPDVPDLVLDLPLTSVVLDMEDESLGILVAKYPNGYRHPTAEPWLKRPTHYACARCRTGASRPRVPLSPRRVLPRTSGRSTKGPASPSSPRIVKKLRPRGHPNTPCHSKSARSPIRAPPVRPSSSA